MDRLPALTLAASFVVSFVVLGCDGAASAPPPQGRVVAVAAEEESGEQLCDVSPSAESAPHLVWPALAAGAAPPPRARWLNVWATWCRPCVEEMPMLVQWTERMRRERAEVELTFLSADASDEAVTAFRSSHPELPSSLRIADPATVSEWATTVGLDAGATLPIHVLTDASGRVRCARTGAVSEDDYERVRDRVRRL